MSRPTALVLAAAGTNRDHDVAFALDLAGAEPRITLLSELIQRPTLLDEGQMVVIAGGFSYADALGAGRMFALQLEHRVGDVLRTFVAAAKPVIGICNGFQVLTRTGLLPGALGHNRAGTFNASGSSSRPPPADASGPPGWLRSTARSPTAKAVTHILIRPGLQAPARSRCATPAATPTDRSTGLPASATPVASSWG